MRPPAVLALLLCAGQVVALPVNTPMSKGDTEVMKCIVEVISDTLSKPSPMPVSQECFETLRGDERILSILRHQNLLKELQDLALQGAKERAHQQKKHSSFEDELSEVVGKQSDQLKEEPEATSSRGPAEKRGESEEAEDGVGVEGDRPQGSPGPEQGSEVEDGQAPGEEEEDAAARLPPALPSRGGPGAQTEGDSAGPSRGLEDGEKDPRAGRGQQAKREDEGPEQAGAGEQRGPEEEEGPTAGFGYKDSPRGWPEALDRAGKAGTEEAQPPTGPGAQEPSRQEEEEKEAAGAPPGLSPGGRSGERERLPQEWEAAQRWRTMDRLAEELTAEKRLEGEAGEQDAPDRSMQLSLRARAHDPRGPSPPLRRGWRPSSREDSVEAGLPLPARGFPEEKKEEEGSANRRAEDQELESLSVIEAELEKVAHWLQALRRG